MHSLTCELLSAPRSYLALFFLSVAIPPPPEATHSHPSFA